MKSKKYCWLIERMMNYNLNFYFTKKMTTKDNENIKEKLNSNWKKETNKIDEVKWETEEKKFTNKFDSKNDKKNFKQFKNNKKDNSKNDKKSAFEEQLLEVRRVTRVNTWWRKLSFRAIVIIWDKKWKVWIWIWKSIDVTSAVSKATNDAYKNIVDVPIVNHFSVPYEISYKYKWARIKIIPASSWTWLKAGSSIRKVLTIAWYNNVLSKIVWTNNKLNNAIACIKALQSYKQDYIVNRISDTKTTSTENIIENKTEKKIEKDNKIDKTSKNEKND